MKSSKLLLLFVVVALGGFSQPRYEAEAQVYAGAHASLAEINRTAWGVGGRLGTIVHQSSDLTLAVEGVVGYFWPSCDLVDCGVTALAANLLGRQRVANYAEVYAGVGVIYENFTVENDQARKTGDDTGFSVLAGTQSGQPGGIRPFLEVRYAWMGNLENQAEASLGLRVPIG